MCVCFHVHSEIEGILQLMFRVSKYVSGSGKGACWRLFLEVVNPKPNPSIFRNFIAGRESSYDFKVEVETFDQRQAPPRVGSTRGSVCEGSGERREANLGGLQWTAPWQSGSMSVARLCLCAFRPRTGPGLYPSLLPRRLHGIRPHAS